MLGLDDVQLVRKEEAGDHESQQTSTSSETRCPSRSPLRLSDTSALALRMSRRLEGSEQSATQQSDAEASVAGTSVGGECRVGTEELCGSLLPQGPGAVGADSSLGHGEEADEAADADSWLHEILDMQARMHGWLEVIRSIVLPPREAARLEELRAGCARTLPRLGLRGGVRWNTPTPAVTPLPPSPASTVPPRCRGRWVDETTLRGLGEPHAPLVRQ